MRLARVLVVSLTIVGLSTASFAGDLQESIAKAAQQPTPSPTPANASGMDHAYLVPGAALFVAGMSMAVYGFLHTSGGEFVSGAVSKESKTGLGATGLGLAAAGGAILFVGQKRASHAPSVSVAPGKVTVAKSIAW